jgi:hypothetical protein
MQSGNASRDRGPGGLRLDVGTLWTLEQDTHSARCALVWVPHAWELRVLIDDQVLLSERCRTQADVLAVAGRWATRLRDCGWSPAGSLPPEPTRWFSA